MVVGSDFGGKLAVAAPKASTKPAYPAGHHPRRPGLPDRVPGAARQGHLPRPLPDRDPERLRGAVELSDPGVPHPERRPPLELALRLLRHARHAGRNWGIQETRFIDAPILANPSATRRIGPRTYRFYFNGSHIHMIAFTQSGTAYWVQNTLLRRPLERRHDRDREVAAAGRMSAGANTQPVGVIGVGYVGLVTGGVLRRPRLRRRLPRHRRPRGSRPARRPRCRSTSPGVDRAAGAQPRRGCAFTLDLDDVLRARAGSSSSASTRRRRTPATPTCRACEPVDRRAARRPASAACW